VVVEFFTLGGDANRDRVVNLRDFNILATNFGKGNKRFSEGDFNYDGTVTLQDLNVLAARFGPSVAPADAFGQRQVGAHDDDEERSTLVQT
jgi:hypothetical protein